MTEPFLALSAGVSTQIWWNAHPSAEVTKPRTLPMEFLVNSTFTLRCFTRPFFIPVGELLLNFSQISLIFGVHLQEV